MAEKIALGKLLLIRIITAVLLLVCSEGLRRFFASFKKPPAKNEVVEKTYIVNGYTVNRDNHDISLEGYGVISSGEMVNISTEISGVVKYLNPKVEVGLTIDKGDTLFKIDDKDYKLAVEREKARIDTLESQIKELQTEVLFTKETVKLQEEELQLAKNEFERQKNLADKGIGSKTAEEQTQRAYITMKSAILASKQRTEASINRINTLKKQIAEAQNMLRIQENNLSKCVVNSPGKLRVTSKMIEEGQLAVPGTTLITMISDDKLEIPVMISGPDVIEWLNLNKENTNLFESLKESDAKISWIESRESKTLGLGKLIRIEEYNSKNRMVKGLVQLTDIKETAAPGMFCKVLIKGKTIKECFRVPRIAIHDLDYLMTIEENRLRKVKINQIYSSGDFTYVIMKDAPASITVVNSKLSNPVEGMKLELEDSNETK